MTNPQKITSVRLLKDSLEKSDESSELQINHDLLEKLYEMFANETTYPNKSPINGLQRILDTHNGNK